MKFNFTTMFILLYVIIFGVHLALWEILEIGREYIFFKYYIFLSLLFIIVLTVLSISKKLYPDMIGFTFLGLLMFKLMMMFLIMQKLNLNEIENYKFHFIPPYLFALILETLFAIQLIKREKNQ